MSSGPQPPGRPAEGARRSTRRPNADNLVPTQGKWIVAIRPNLSTTQAESGRRSATASQDLMSREGEAFDPRTSQQDDVGGSVILPNPERARKNTSNQQGSATAPKNVSGTDLSTAHKDQIAGVIREVTHPRERKKILEKMLSDLIKSSSKNAVQKRNAVNLYRRTITQQDDEMEELEKEQQERQNKKAEVGREKQERQEQEKPGGMRKLPRIREKPKPQSIVQGRTVTSGFPFGDNTVTSTEQRTATDGGGGASAATSEAARPDSPISPKELDEMLDCYFPRTQREHTRDKRTRS